MSTSVMSNRPRTTASFCGLSIPPTISHPTTSKGDPSLLNIQGSAKNENGYLTYRDISNDSYKYITPKSTARSLQFPIKPLVKGQSDRLSLEDIECVIRDKMRKERYSVQCLFKNSDIHGQGFVTKGALLKILYTLSPHVTFDHFNKLLERYGLDEKTVITFPEFEYCFGTPPAGRFSAPVSMMSSGAGKFISVAFATQLLRQFAMEPGFCLSDILPPACFQPSGIILMPQWRDAMKRININLNEQDFVKFWIRFDTEGCGSVRTAHMCKTLNLDSQGRPLLQTSRAPTAASHKASASARDPKKSSRAATGKAKQNGPPIIAIDGTPRPSTGKVGETFMVSERQTCDQRDRPASGETTGIEGQPKYTRRLKILRNHRPKFNSIIDCLLFQLEEPYQAMMVTFERLEVGSTSKVTIEQFREVLREYSFKISDANVDKFITLVNLKRFPRDTISYRDFLDKFQTRGDFTYVSRIIKKLCKSWQEDPGLGSDMLTPEELEMKLVDHLHSDYIKLMTTFQSMDTDKKRVLHPDQIRQAVDSVLGYSITDEQFQDLVKEFESDANQNLVYEPFLARFNKPSNICKRKTTQAENELTKTGVPYVKPKSVRRRPEIPTRTFYVLSCQVEDLIKSYFHKFDKYYKQLSRSKIDVMTKSQFGETLEYYNLPVTDDELDHLWATMGPISNTWSYRQMLRHFMTNLKRIALIEEQRDRHNQLKGISDPSLQRLRDFRQQRKAQKAAELRAMESHIARSEYQKPRQVDDSTVAQLCERVRPVIVAHWDSIKDYLRDCDIVGYATVEVRQMKELARFFNFGLTDEELDNLCIGFDFKKNGRFSYIPFLKRFVTNSLNPSDETRFNSLTHKLRNQKNGENLPLFHVIDRFREQILKDYNSLLRGFRKLDVCHSGLLEIYQFQSVLTKAGVMLNEDDLYHILSEFDVNMDGKVDYQEFVRKCINVK